MSDFVFGVSTRLLSAARCTTRVAGNSMRSAMDELLTSTPYVSNRFRSWIDGVRTVTTTLPMKRRSPLVGCAYRSDGWVSIAFIISM